MASGKGIFDVILGAAEIAAGILITIGTFGGGAPLGAMLIVSGAGMVLSGIGTIMQGNPPDGTSTAVRNPIAPWDIVYGKTRVGGTLVYLHTWGGDWKVLDMVVVVAAHHCDSLQEVLFDQQRLQIDPNKVSPGAGLGSGTSFSPAQQRTSITSITRDARGVVTVVLPANIPYLTAGDPINILDSGGGSSLRTHGLTGRVQVAQIISQVFGNPGAITFTYLSGGSAVSLSTGEIFTAFIDHGNLIYIETMGFGGPSAPMGNQTLGQTFPGMLNGTPWRGDVHQLLSPTSYGHFGETLPHGSTGYNTSENPITPNPWTANCSLVGKAAVFIRIEFNENDRALQTIPQLSFLIQGKNDIYDPNTGGYGYTDNAALCIADFLSNQTWGFKANYGTDIPDQPLKDAIAICNQDIPLLHGGTEKCWACDGRFDLNMKRGETLQNLLTSCAGRLTYYQGQYIIHPAYASVSTGLTTDQQYSPLSGTVDFEAIAAGPMTWKPTTSIRDLYNGVKGTYYSPEHHWEVADFPPYAQDANHGYAGPSLYGGDINLAFDGGDRRWLDIQLPFTTSYARAQRIAKVELLRRRAQGGASRGTGTFVSNMTAYQFAPLDIINAAVSFFGWTSKQLEIAAVRLRYEQSENDAFMLATEIDVQEVDSDIYQWTPGTLSIQGEELTPQGYVTGQLPKGQVTELFPFPWSPGYVSPLSGDAIPGPATFGVQPVYGTDAQGNGTITLQIKGITPINKPNTGIFPPQISAASSTTGGTLAAGNYVVALSARGSGSVPHHNTDYLDYGYATVTGTTGSIIVTINFWSPGDDGGDLYLALKTASENYQFHYAGAVAPAAATATITSLDLTAPGGPDPDLDHYGVIWQPVIHSGPFAQQIAAVTATTITLASNGMTTNQWAGYTLSLVAKESASVEIPILNMPIASSTASSGGFFVLTIGANSLGLTLPSLTSLLAIGDVVAMRHHATFTDASFSDANIANPFYPGGATGVEAGHVAVVLSGADAGDVQTIASVTGGGTTFNLAGLWAITPATGDLVIICAASSAPEVAGSAISTTDSITGVVAAVNVQNLANATWLFRVRTEDVSGNHCDDMFAPFREVYFFGSIVPGGTGGQSVFGPNGGDAYPVYQDALYAQALFAVLPTSRPQDDGSVVAGAVVSPMVPPTQFSTLIDAPILDPAVTMTAGAGTIPGGQTIYLAIAAIDTGGITTDLSDVIPIVIPAGVNYKLDFTVNNYVAGMTLFFCYIASQTGALYYRRNNSAGATFSLTSIVTVSGDSPGVPDRNFDHFIARTTKVLLAGSFGGRAASTSTISAIVASGGNHYKLTLTGAAFTPSALIGRVASSIVQGTGNPTPLQDYTITANDATSVTVVAPPPSGSWHGPSPSYSNGDQVVIRLKPDIYTGITIGDSLLAMTTDEFKDCVVRIFFADGTNQTAFIASNDATTLTLQSAFGGPAPLWFWVEASSFSASFPATPNDVQAETVDIFAPIDNEAGYNAVQVFAATASGDESAPGNSTIRDFWCPGYSGNNGAPGYFTVALDGSNEFVIDLANGRNQRLVLDTTTATGIPPVTIATIPKPIFTGGTIAPGDSFSLYVDQDPAGGWPEPIFNRHKTLLDPGFESGALGSWSTSPGPSSVTSDQTHDGAFAAEDTTSGNFIYQDVTGLTPGQEYVIEAWLLATAAGAGNLYVHDGTGANVVTGPTSSPLSWARVAVLYTANSTGTVRVHLHHNATTDPIYWDDVAVYESGGFAGDAGRQHIEGTPNTRSAYIFTWHGTTWGLDSFRTGGSIS